MHIYKTGRYSLGNNQMIMITSRIGMWDDGIVELIEKNMQMGIVESHKNKK